MRVIHYEDWRLWADPGPAIARQYDNLTRRLEITGDLPEGWDWTLLVEADREHLDLIALRPMEGGLGVDLTAEMLALSGYYTIQLRGNQGELARHTNQVRIFIPSSLSGDANWPEVPSEFSQAEADIHKYRIAGILYSFHKGFHSMSAHLMTSDLPVFHNPISGTYKRIIQTHHAFLQTCRGSNNFKSRARFVGIIDTSVSPHLVQCILKFFVGKRVPLSGI